MIKKMIPKLIGAYLNTLAFIAPSKVGKIGYNIFCTPLAPPVKQHHHKFLNTATQFTFVSDGVTLQGYQWGTGVKKVAFFHGWQSHSYRWKKYIEIFPHDEYTLYAFDGPAHGLSKGRYTNIPIYSDAISVFMEKVGRLDAIIAHSMGSFSLLHALHHHPHLSVGRLVLMGSPGEAQDFITFYQQFTGLSDRTFRFILDFFEKKLKRTPDYFSAPRFAATLRVPGVIIHDEADDEAPYKHAVRIHKVWPHSKLITTQGFGHNLRAPEVLEMVKDYVIERELQEAKE
jgi:pimeloyl-ACP methyl ester carboxylesterase